MKIRNRHIFITQGQDEDYIVIEFLKNNPQVHIWAVVAEWLRRLTRNQIPSGSVGSSPTDRERQHFF